MIWLTWKQFRLPWLAAAGAMTLLALVLATTGPQVAHLYVTLGRGYDCPGLNCVPFREALLSHFPTLSKLLPAVVAVPALVGAFWGAPLVARELETGTSRLAWTQSITRTRWLVTKLMTVGLACVLVTEVFALMVGWWAHPFNRLISTRLDPGFFEQGGLMPAAHAVFAFLLAATVGIILRRTIPALVVTLVAYFAAVWATVNWVQPHLAQPLTLTRGITHGAVMFAPYLGPRGALILTDTITTATGQRYHPSLAGCIGNPDPQCPAQVHAYLAKFHEVITYQPAGRYWQFQAEEAALFVGSSLLLAVLLFWWLHHRLDS